MGNYRTTILIMKLKTACVFSLAACSITLLGSILGIIASLMTNFSLEYFTILAVKDIIPNILYLIFFVTLYNKTK